jgi:hypothetical protein
MCFVRISEQRAIISLYSTNGYVSVTEMENVYCAIRTEFLNIIHVTLDLERINKHYILHKVYVFLLVL